MTSVARPFRWSFSIGGRAAFLAGAIDRADQWPSGACFPEISWDTGRHGNTNNTTPIIFKAALRKPRGVGGQTSVHHMMFRVRHMRSVTVEKYQADILWETEENQLPQVVIVPQMLNGRFVGPCQA